MPVTASIKFVQGLSTPPAGEALIGVLTTPVDVTNDDNSNVAIWEWEIIDVPPTSTVPTGVVSVGAVPTLQFIPDARGGYLIHLTVKDLAGNQAEDFRVFQVPEASGRLIPPKDATDRSLNFSGGPRGWAPIMEDWLRYVDTIVGADADNEWGTRSIAFADSPYTVVSGDHLIQYNATAGAIAVTLPTLPNVGFTIKLKEVANSEVNALTVSAGGGGNIDGGTVVLQQKRAELRLIHIGANIWTKLDGLVVQDEGTTLAGGTYRQFNFVGAGVTAADAGNGKTIITIPGGGGTPAVIFDGGATTENIRSDRTANQSSIVNTRDGLNNFGSDVAGGHGIGTADYASILGGDEGEIGLGSDSSYSVICGGGNFAATGNNRIGNGATPSTFSFIGGGSGNFLEGDWSVIVGGYQNAAGLSSYIFIGGGNGNGCGGTYAVICGGNANATNDAASHPTVCGGSQNFVNTTGGFIGGGEGNVIDIGAGDYAAILGGIKGRALRYAQESFASGAWAVTGETTGNRQRSQYFVYGTQSGAGSVELLDDAAGHLNLEDDHDYVIRATCQISRTDAPGRSTFIHTLLVHATAGVSVIDLDNADLSFPNGEAWTIAYTAVGNAIVATLTGAAAQDIRSVVSYEWLENTSRL